MKNAQLSSLIAALPLALSGNVTAETLWSSNSFSYLKNTSDFEVLTNDSIDVFTFEHVSGHNWGDLFLFADRTLADADNETPEFKGTYGEISPRLSLSYAFGKDMSFGIIKDTYLATTFEMSSDTFGSFDNVLVGIGTDLAIPHFTFVKANVYYANNDNIDDDYQLTMSWGYNFPSANHKVSFNGFFDWSSAADDHESEFHFNPQLLVDVGHYFEKPGHFEAGIEYSYWNNKYGISGLDDESVVSAMIKVTL
ncbi:outer membrane protein OmpK [Thalassotalea eurytherma]|uniref:Ion channel protein Tsx n=1 Tax=Thalassotalea eurytherma TaxID=1144278 RepID=A0ABQ6H780_9GAMM|nr:outer membrane protein OmpK [Thalassotalea eurytherma]GLX82311.1 ion channel protein Tsx [Thalassotalea eurytherma]